MTTLQHKQNPFGLLEHSDSDEEDHTKTAKPKKPTQSTGANKDSKQGPSQAKPKTEASQAKNLLQEAPRAVNKTINVNQVDSKDKAPHIRPKEPRKLKGVPAEPHPLDRHSGTGLNPWDQKGKKGGAGKYNVGTVKDELKGIEGGEQGAEEVNEEEAEKETGITLAEYYQLKGYSQEESQKQVNEAKSKVTQQELLKEIGTAKPLQSRAQTKVDEKDSQKKKIITEHAVGINTEHADLLGFKTGFKTYTERKPFDPSDPRKPYEASGKPAQQSEKKPEEGGSPQIKPEGQQAGTEAGEAIAEPGQTQYNKGPRQGGERKYNPNWKPRDQQPRDQQRDQQREQPRGDRRGGDNRPPNFEDEKAFPKLG